MNVRRKIRALPILCNAYVHTVYINAQTLCRHVWHAMNGSGGGLYIQKLLQETAKEIPLKCTAIMVLSHCHQT